MEKGYKRAPLLAVKLIVGLLYPADAPELREWARERLVALFGGIQRESRAFPFDCTDYYRSIAASLMRCFFSFAGLRHPEGLAAWKRAAIGIEAESAPADRGGRRVNIDPGYLDGARLVLASTKDNAQRIYLRDGIFAEVTLCHRKFGWERFSYTFPDFQSGTYDAFLDCVRRDWQNEIRLPTEEGEMRK